MPFGRRIQFIHPAEAGHDPGWRYDRGQTMSGLSGADLFMASNSMNIGLKANIEWLGCPARSCTRSLLAVHFSARNGHFPPLHRAKTRL
jgi:hypothetical protein